MDDDAEIVAEFLVESHENLDQLDRDLVELERTPDSRELLSSIFRTIHTIKGTSGFLAFNRLEALTHVGENLLSRLRDGKMVMTTHTAGALLTMVDTVRALLEAIEHGAGDADPGVDVESVVSLLERVLAGDVEEPAAAAAEGGEQATVSELESVQDAPPAQAAVEGGEQATVTATDSVEDAPPAAAAAPAHEPDPVAEELLDPVLDQAPEDVPAAAEVEEGRRGVVDSSVRVDVDLLDGLVQLVGELVLTRNQILQRTEAADDVELVRASQRLDLVASELQESVMRTRMQPIGQVWSKMPRIVRDLAHQLGREVDLEMDGHDTELDRSLLEALKGPLTHLVGKGIDPRHIGDVAVRRGVVTREQLARMEPRDVLDLIFRPGFSTAEQVTNVSGRGVGMDVVRTSIERIGGSVDLTSTVGCGTTMRIRIPLTLAIIPALVVGQQGERYAIPQANLVELVRLEGQDLRENVETLAGAPVLRLRGRLLPLVSLSEALGGEKADPDGLTIVVVQADETRFGLCVEEVHDTQEIVVKPIGRQLKSLPTYAGATIMGDGRVALILDVGGIARTRAIGAAHATEPEVQVGTVDSRALLVLEVSQGRRAALPLTAVSRLEEFELGRVERSGGVEVVQYRDGILPLLRLAPAIGLAESPPAEDQISVVVHEDGQHRVGIVIDRVLDVVEEHVVPTEVGRRNGVLGSAVVQDKVTDLVDLDAVVRPLLAGAR